MRKPLFPFDLPAYVALQLVEASEDYRQTYEKRVGYSRVDQLSITGTVNEDRTLDLVAYIGTFDGFVHSANTFWKKTVKVPEATFSRYVGAEFERRATVELNAEAEAEWKAKVRTRIQDLQAEFNIKE